jgi:hypothetical protein
MTISRRRRLLISLALPLLAACERAQRGPRGDALPASRVGGPSEPAPIPSDVTDDYEAARRGSRVPTPRGPDVMPGFDPAQRVGTDIMMAPVPRPLPR